MKNSVACSTAPGMFWTGNLCYMSPTCVALLIETEHLVYTSVMQMISGNIVPHDTVLTAKMAYFWQCISQSEITKYLSQTYDSDIEIVQL